MRALTIFWRFSNMASLGTCSETFTFPSPVHMQKVMKNTQRGWCRQSSEEQMSIGWYRQISVHLSCMQALYRWMNKGVSKSSFSCCVSLIAILPTQTTLPFTGLSAGDTGTMWIERNNLEICNLLQWTLSHRGAGVINGRGSNHIPPPFLRCLGHITVYSWNYLSLNTHIQQEALRVSHW